MGTIHMTYPDSKPDRLEIEVTPEMIATGAEIIATRWFELAEPSEPELFEEVAAEILEVTQESP